jgi:hypothetical protein
MRDSYTKSFYYLENCEDLRALILYFFCNMRGPLPAWMTWSQNEREAQKTEYNDTLRCSRCERFVPHQTDVDHVVWTLQEQKLGYSVGLRHAFHLGSLSVNKSQQCGGIDLRCDIRCCWPVVS